jgi:Plasmid pRiA4b ORF-3-like protein
VNIQQLPIFDIVTLTVQIDEVSPPVMRRVEVPLTMRLDDLHFVLQVAIGWQNCHPFEFRIGDKAWGLVDREGIDNPLPAETVNLSDIMPLSTRFEYNYVYGDDWHHTVAVESVGKPAPGVIYPRLTHAEGRCPPADIGGPSGYEAYLQALGDPDHFHHEAMVEWDEADFDPNNANLPSLQNNLANLAKYIGRRKLVA